MEIFTRLALPALFFVFCAWQFYSYRKLQLKNKKKLQQMKDNMMDVVKRERRTR